MSDCAPEFEQHEPASVEGPPGPEGPPGLEGPPGPAGEGGLVPLNAEPTLLPLTPPELSLDIEALAATTSGNTIQIFSIAGEEELTFLHEIEVFWKTRAPL